MKGIFKAVKESAIDKQESENSDVVSDFKFDFDYHHPTGAVEKKKKKKRKKKTATGKSDGNDDDDDNEEDDVKTTATDQSFSEYDTPIVKDLTSLISDNYDSIVSPPGLGITKDIDSKTTTSTVPNPKTKQQSKQPSGAPKTAAVSVTQVAPKAANKSESKPKAVPTPTTTNQPKQQLQQQPNNNNKAKSGKQSTTSSNKQSNSKKDSKSSASDDFDFDAMLSDFTKADLKNAPQVVVAPKKPVLGVFSKNKLQQAAQIPKDKIRFLSPKDPELQPTEQLKAKYGNGKNLVAIGPKKVRDPNWSGASSSGAGGCDISVSGSCGGGGGGKVGGVVGSDNADKKGSGSGVGKMSGGGTKPAAVEPVLHSSVFSFSFGGL
jgi:hypothetical protein